MVKRLRLRPFTAATRVRVPSGSPPFFYRHKYGGIAQPVERPPHTRKVTDSSSVVSTKILKSKGFRIFCLAEKHQKQKHLKPNGFCICQAKVDTKKPIVLEAQFGLVLNWAFIAQSGRRPPVIKVIHILIQQLRNVLSSLQTEVKV